MGKMTISFLALFSLFGSSCPFLFSCVHIITPAQTDGHQGHACSDAGASEASRRRGMLARNSTAPHRAHK